LRTTRPRFVWLAGSSNDGLSKKDVA
jgi:hypothetical protein